MASISAAISAMATWGSTVAGIVHSYDLNALPEKLGRDKLPCLLTLPETGQEQGFDTLSMMGNDPEVNFDVTHLLLYTSADSMDARKALPGLITLLDAYLTALKAQPYFVTLGSTTPPVHHGARPTFMVGITDFAGTKFHSIQFLHRLVLYL